VWTYAFNSGSVAARGGWRKWCWVVLAETLDLVEDCGVVLVGCRELLVIEHVAC